jgi:hypothetical protein
MPLIRANRSDWLFAASIAWVLTLAGMFLYVLFGLGLMG